MADKNKPVPREENMRHVQPNSANTSKAHQQADEDIAKDPDLSIHSPNDDLDEGETARLGEDTSEMI